MPLPLLAMAGGAALSGLGSYFGGRSAASAQKDIANRMLEASRPRDITSGYGQATVDPVTGQITTGLSGQAADWQNRMFQMANDQPMNSGAGYMGQGQGMLNAAMGMAPTDVAGLAGSQYDLMKQMALPGQQQQQGNLIASLAARGMLGASGGAGQMSAMMGAQGQQDLAMQQSALDQARATAQLQGNLQNQMFGQGLNLGQFGQQLSQQDIQNMMGFGQAGVGMFGLEDQLRQASMSQGQMAGQAMGQAAPYLQGANQSPGWAALGGFGQGMLNYGMMQGMQQPQQTQWGTTPGSQQSGMLYDQTRGF